MYIFGCKLFENWLSLPEVQTIKYSVFGTIELYFRYVPYVFVRATIVTSTQSSTPFLSTYSDYHIHTYPHACGFSVLVCECVRESIHARVVYSISPGIDVGVARISATYSCITKKVAANATANQ